MIVVIGCHMPFLLNLDQRFLNRVLIIINSNVNIPQALVTVDKFGFMFRPIGLLAPKEFYFIWLAKCLTMSVLDDGGRRLFHVINTSHAPN